MNEPFTQYRPYLFSIAYRMLGSVMDAEDMVQEAWLRWQKSNQRTVQTPKSFLAAITTRLCIDHLRSAKVQRESYFGQWLPEPLLSESTEDGEAMMLVADNVSFAFLRLLERLSPTERAVFLLRNVFDYEYSEIAEVVEKSEAACRQLYRRARQHLADERPRFDHDLAEQKQVMGQFWQACLESDVQALKRLVAEDVVFYSDGGGKATAALNPIYSAEKVIRFVVALVKQAPEGLALHQTMVNAQPGVMVTVNGRLFNIFVLDIRNGRVQTIYSVLNPDKLQHINIYSSGGADKKTQ